MTWSPRAVRALAAGLAALLLVVGYWWWAGRARSVIPLPEESAVSVDDSGLVAQVVVHVAGKVRQPGVVRLPAGSRVIDAVEAAGGVRAGAHAGDINLARTLTDGEQIVVGRRSGTDVDGKSASNASGSGEATSTLVDINTATTSELESLPGIGPVLAGRIVQWRTDNGPFTAVDVLGEVSGIGESLLEQLRPLVRV
ncbi:MAG: ComEA family DNA-binding protein [Candidatus Nanopelagicales bacterium]